MFENHFPILEKSKWLGDVILTHRYLIARNLDGISERLCIALALPEWSIDFLLTDVSSSFFPQTQLSQTTCLSACKHISALLIERILSPEVRAISFGALDQMSLDLMQCEGKIPWFHPDQLTILLSYSIRITDQHFQFRQWNLNPMFSRSSSSKRTENFIRRLRRIASSYPI